MHIDLSKIKSGFSDRLRAITFHIALTKFKKKTYFSIYEKKNYQCPFTGRREHGALTMVHAENKGSEVIMARKFELDSNRAAAGLNSQACGVPACATRPTG